MKFRTLIYNVLLAGAVVSCNSEGYHEPSAEGYIDLKVTMDASVDDVTVTKSSSASPVIAVQVLAADGKVAYQCDDISAVTEPVKLPTGDYEVVATSGADFGVAAFDSPFYSGSTSVQVRAFTVSQAKVECELDAVMTTVSFSQQIKDNFKYSLAISNGLGTLTYDSANEDKAGYFTATGKLDWVLNLENKNGEKFVVKDTYTDVSAKQHYAFNFSLEDIKEESYGVTEFRVILDNSLNETYHTPTIWINEDGPSIAGEDGHEIYVSDSPSNVLYNINSTRNYNSIVIGHNDSRLLDLGLPYSTDIVAAGMPGFIGNSTVSVEALENLGVRIDFTSFMDSLPIGEYSVRIFVENESGLTVEKNITFVINSCVRLLGTEPWAKFMFVKGEWISAVQPSDLKVQYRLSGSSQWTDFVPSEASQLVVDQSKKTVKAYICGLTASSTYEVRIVSAHEATVAVISKTETADQLYNMNFDAWYQNGKVWYPYYQDSSSPRVWDSANKGTTMAGDSNTVPGTASGEYVKGKSVKMTTIWVNALGITKLAAGNVYTGRYNGTVGTNGADLDWGVEFTSRPLGFRGYYRYDAKSINRTGDGYGSYSGQPDLCQVQIVLQDAGQPYFVVPTTFNGVSVNGPTLDRNVYCNLETHSSVVARGIQNYGDTGGTFKQITLPFTYRSTTRIPTHAIVTFSSSYLGDYFTGGEGSTMWADEFEYIYDPMELPAESREAFFSLFK